MLPLRRRLCTLTAVHADGARAERTSSPSLRPKCMQPVPTPHMRSGRTGTMWTACAGWATLC